MKLDRLLLAIALVVQVRAGRDDLAGLEKNLRDVFARLPKIYEDWYPAVENCTKFGPDLLIYGMSTALTVTSEGDAIRCYPTICFIKFILKWLRAKSRSGPEQVFFENTELEILVDVQDGVPSLQADSMSRFSAAIKLRSGYDSSLLQMAARACVLRKRDHFERTLARALQEIGQR